MPMLRRSQGWIWRARMVSRVRCWMFERYWDFAKSSKAYSRYWSMSLFVSRMKDEGSGLYPSFSVSLACHFTFG